ncbi:hypothetical protein ANO11243_093630 [Dothideomycetidae sp. 11243]|nr:hypothetical protein ANO11243_093630 [fungal sp. No.11243]
MLLSNVFLPALALVCLADAQGIKFDQILKKKPGLAHTTNTKPPITHTTQIASSIVKHMKSIKPTTTTTKKSAKPTAKAGTAGAAIPKVKAAACAPATPLYSYIPSDNSPSGFIVDASLASLAKAAVLYPAGYSTSFTNAYGSLFANNYLTAYDLPSYNASACAAYCNAYPSCTAFNVYIERQPSLYPADSCSNPSAITGIRCALWNDTVTASQAQNVGQWRVNFMVVIQGSNGYNKNPASSTISGYQAAVPLAGAVDVRPLIATGATDPTVASGFVTSGNSAQQCASLCTNATTSARNAAISSGATSYSPCNYFNTVQISVNGAVQGTYCQLYTQDVSAYAGLYNATYAGVTYDLVSSYGYAVSSPDSGVISASSSAAPTSTYAGLTVAPSSVSYVTVTSAWASKTTATTTIIKGTIGTVLIQTPGSVSSTAAPSYTTVSTNGGSGSTISTTTVAPTVSGGPSVVRVAYPTATSCSNTGIRYAAYQNVWAGGVDTYGNYTQYDPTSFKTLKPMYNGTTSFIAETNSGWVSWIKVYDQYVMANNLTLDHVFYVYANQDGYYSFTMPQGDNIVLLWLGAKAVSGWTRPNADLTQYYTSSPTKVQQTITVQLKLGQYLPVRLHWGNRQGDGEVDLNVYGPDGNLVMYSNVGQGTGWAGPNVVQFPCDSTLGPQFPWWGAET